MNKTYYCPDCGEILEEESGCGSVSYFCPKCRELKSRKRILEEPLKKEEDSKSQ